MKPNQLAICVAAMALATTLAACQQPTAGRSVAKPAKGSASDTEAQPAQPNAGTSHDSKSTPPTGAGILEKTCKGVTFRIVSGAGAEGTTIAAETVLGVVGQDGVVVSIEKPVEMTEYTAVGLGCAIAATDDQPYFVVQFGELPYGCSFCEWFYLYDASGQQLTRSQPPILIDRTLPPSQQHMPNNREYTQETNELGIPPPEIDYLY